MDYSLFNILLYAWIGLAVITFISLFFISAPYGRFVRKNWGPEIPNWLGWIIMELPSPVLVVYFVVTGEGLKNAVIWFIVALWVLHYFHRTFIYPFRITSRNKKMPFAVALMALVFNLGNIAGLILFFVGVFINLQSDQILINLRKNTEEGYAIPRGGMFKYVSSPNYFGELVEWLGFAIMAAGLPGFSFFIWTFANLVPRAIDNHKWYKQTFDNYPKDRKAIFPFIL